MSFIEIKDKETESLPQDNEKEQQVEILDIDPSEY